MVRRRRDDHARESRQDEDTAMKTDAQVQMDVVEELRWDPSVRDSGIEVSAKDGVITLSGVVETYAEKHAAERAAQRVAGVRGIAEDITVRLSPTGKRSDTRPRACRGVPAPLGHPGPAPPDQGDSGERV